jgi:hypothetical protein
MQEKSSEYERRVARFFAFARARHEIYLRKSAMQPWPWTDDPILGTYRFTNVYRELDATTVALRKLTDQIRSREEVLTFIVQMRWLNRRESWQAMLDYTGGSVLNLAHMLERPDSLVELREHLKRAIPSGPWVTGAYIIKTPNGMTKLDGVFEAMNQFATQSRDYQKSPLSAYEVAQHLRSHPGQETLQDVWEWLCRFNFQGQFTAYEAISDIRHTALLDRAPDIMTWANAGPGAMRGLNRVHDRDLFYTRRSHPWHEEMRELLKVSQDGMHWPAPTEAWPALEMREIEHTLCEFDKYERTRLGEGRPRGTYP